MTMCTVLGARAELARRWVGGWPLARQVWGTSWVSSASAAALHLVFCKVPEKSLNAFFPGYQLAFAAATVASTFIRCAWDPAVQLKLCLVLACQVLCFPHNEMGLGV